MSKLTQESQVIGPEISDVVDAIHQQRDALHAHAEGEPAKPIRIVAAVCEHHGMHHTRAHDLQPAGAFTQAASFARTDHAIHVHFDARLGEREVAGANAYLPILTK